MESLFPNRTSAGRYILDQMCEGISVGLDASGGEQHGEKQDEGERKRETTEYLHRSTS